MNYPRRRPVGLRRRETGRCRIGLNWVKNAASSVWSWIKGAASSIGNAAKQAASSAWNWTKQAAATAWNWARHAATSAWNWTKEASAAAWTRTKQAAVVGMEHHQDRGRDSLDYHEIGGQRGRALDTGRRRRGRDMAQKHCIVVWDSTVFRIIAHLTWGAFGTAIGALVTTFNLTVGNVVTAIYNQVADAAHQWDYATINVGGPNDNLPMIGNYGGLFNLASFRQALTIGPFCSLAGPAQMREQRAGRT